MNTFQSSPRANPQINRSTSAVPYLYPRRRSDVPEDLLPIIGPVDPVQLPLRARESSVRSLALRQSFESDPTDLFALHSIDFSSGPAHYSLGQSTSRREQASTSQSSSKFPRLESESRPQPPVASPPKHRELWKPSPLSSTESGERRSSDPDQWKSCLLPDHSSPSDGTQPLSSGNTGGDSLCSQGTARIHPADSDSSESAPTKKNPITKTHDT